MIWHSNSIPSVQYQSAWVHSWWWDAFMSSTLSYPIPRLRHWTCSIANEWDGRTSRAECMALMANVYRLQTTSWSLCLCHSVLQKTFLDPEGNGCVLFHSPTRKIIQSADRDHFSWRSPLFRLLIRMRERERFLLILFFQSDEERTRTNNRIDVVRIQSLSLSSIDESWLNILPRINANKWIFTLDSSLGLRSLSSFSCSKNSIMETVSCHWQRSTERSFIGTRSSAPIDKRWCALSKLLISIKSVFFSASSCLVS